MINKIGVIIPAAGQGRRMRGTENKVFLDLDGRSILLRTLDIFQGLPEICAIVIAVGGTEKERVQTLVDGRRNVKVVVGGSCRQESVAEALAVLPNEAEYVLVHDAARPLLPRAGLEAFLQEAKGLDAVIMAVPVKDTLKRVNEDHIVLETPPREEWWSAQTPQMFRRDRLEEAHAAARAMGFQSTDDASLLEWRGYPVKILPGWYENIKITSPEDIIWARALLEARQQRRADECGSV